MLGSTTVDREKLLAALKSNKEKHVAEFAEAMTNYKEQAVKALRKRANEINGGDETSLRFDLPTPQSYEESYNQAIAMVEWSVDPTIELDEDNFSSFIMDRWTWSGQFLAATAHYNNRS